MLWSCCCVARASIGRQLFPPWQRSLQCPHIHVCCNCCALRPNGAGATAQLQYTFAYVSVHVLCAMYLPCAYGADKVICKGSSTEHVPVEPLHHSIHTIEQTYPEMPTHVSQQSKRARRCGSNNSAMFADIVPEQLRSTVYAFDRSFEGAVAACAAPLVGVCTFCLSPPSTPLPTTHTY